MMRSGRTATKGASLCLSLLALLALSCSDTKLKLADGERLAKSTLDSKYLVINHWATWCAPCRVEIPELNLLAASLDTNEVRLFGYGEDFHEGQALLDDIAEMGIEFPVFADDPAEVWGYGRSSVLPRTAIIAPGGEVKQVLLGPQTQESLLAALDAN